MPRDSNGNASTDPVYVATPGTTIRAVQHNTPIADIIQMLTGSLARNGTGGMLADLAMGGFKITGLANGASAQDAVTKAQLDATTTAMNGKVSKSGDTMTAPLTVTYNGNIGGFVTQSTLSTGWSCLRTIAANGTKSYAEFGQRETGQGYVLVNGREWKFNYSDDYLLLPGGGKLPGDGNPYVTTFGLNTLLLTIIARQSRIRLAAVVEWNLLTSGTVNLGNGHVVTGMVAGGGGRINSAYYRQLQQTDIWGNWYAVGSD